jgi:hypothetical protein
MTSSIIAMMAFLQQQEIQVHIRDPWGLDAVEQTTTITCGASTSTIRFRNRGGRGEITLVRIDGRRLPRAEAEIAGWINGQRIESLQPEFCAPTSDDDHPGSRWLIVAGGAAQQHVHFFLVRFSVRSVR